MLSISTAGQRLMRPKADKDTFLTGFREEFLKLAKTPNPQVILDVGCGTGRLLRKAKQQWPDAHLVGVDAAEKMIQQATELFPEAEFHVAMAEALPLPDASVDLAFSTMSFHHWANQAQGHQGSRSCSEAAGNVCARRHCGSSLDDAFCEAF